MKIKNSIFHFITFLAIQATLSIFTYSAQALTSAEGGFKIQMPGTPKLQQANHKSLVGDVKENTYTLKTPNEEWSVSYTLLPNIAVSMESDQALLNQAKDGFVKDTGAQAVKFEKIQLQNKEGRELTFQIPAQNNQKPKEGKARFVIADKKMYVVVGIINQGNLSRVVSFLNSFKLIASKK